LLEYKKKSKKISRAELKGSLDFHYFIATVIYIGVLQQVDEISYEKN
jgi:hypothetical protein